MQVSQSLTVLGVDRVGNLSMYDNKFHEYRADFLVASDLALRAQLTEFRDHQLVNYLTVSKRNGKVRFRILLVF